MSQGWQDSDSWVPPAPALSRPAAPNLENALKAEKALWNISLRVLSYFTLTKLTFKYFDAVHYVPGTRNSLKCEHQLFQIQPN